ncbi:hypothetical protein CS542_06710 [Pedobacter sp. IW39]|nr:hypothetical protein CS542_06710 [Pedobacter sp. IW39]
MPLQIYMTIFRTKLLNGLQTLKDDIEQNTIQSLTLIRKSNHIRLCAIGNHGRKRFRHFSYSVLSNAFHLAIIKL